MNVFKHIRNMLEPNSRTDPVFGSITLQRPGDLWEGTVWFSPTEKEIEIFIDAPESGPTNQHHQFYRDIEQHYNAFFPQVAEKLLNTYISRRQPLNYEGVWHEFTLAACSIPNPEAHPVSWTLMYDCASDTHSFDVEMQDWQPVSVSIQG
jgi:hypothetical protein